LWDSSTPINPAMEKWVRRRWKSIVEDDDNENG